jgi:hypothetical protein
MTTPNSMTREQITTAHLTIVPANKASWADLQEISGTTDYPASATANASKTRDCRSRNMALPQQRLRSCCLWINLSHLRAARPRRPRHDRLLTPTRRPRLGRIAQ